MKSAIRRWSVRFGFGLALVSALGATTIEAQTPAVDPAAQQAEAYAAAISEAERLDGLLTLYRRKDGMLLELSAANLDHPYLLFMALKTGIGQGFLVSGVQMFDEWIISFHRDGQRIEFRRVNTRFTAPSDAQMGWVVKEGYGDSVVAAVPILAENTDAGTVLIDLSSIFFQDLPDLTGLLRIHFPFPYGLDPSRTTWGTVKNFPLNLELDVNQTFYTNVVYDLGSVPDNRALPMTMRYSIVEPPDPSGYTPRLADDRVGFFVTAIKDLSKPSSEDNFVRYINRWALEKANPAAERSAPKQPLVIYIEKSVPFAFRPAVRRGVLEWNRAFEDIGLVDAIEVRFQPEDADWDAEDVRYSTIRWSTDGAFGALGPSRGDPRTGQIFDTDILVNSESLRGFQLDWRLTNQGSNPSGSGSTLGLPGLALSGGAASSREAAWLEDRARSGQSCTIGHGLAREIGIGLLSLQLGGVMAPGSTPPPEYLDAAVKMVVMHEFGHSLGLRHNFKGSAATPYDKLNDAEYTREHGLSGSVMDYLAVNVARPGGQQGEYFPSALGAYDRWVIEYGYKQFGSEPEADELNKIASRSNEPALAYGTDTDFYGPPFLVVDPYVNQFDLSSEPLSWANDSADLVRWCLDEKLLDKLVADGERFQVKRRLVFALMIRLYQGMDIAARMVAGYNVQRIHKGQAADQNYLTPIPASLQREAFSFLRRVGFADDLFLLSPEILNSLPPETWAHWGMGGLDLGTTDFPLQQLVELIRETILDRLLTPAVLTRLANAELLVDAKADKFTLSEMLRTLTDTVWSELTADVPTTGGEMVSRFRRSLQRAHLDRLISMVLTRDYALTQDAVALARLELVDLSKNLEAALSGDSMGPLTEAHFRECLRLAKSALEAKARLTHR